MSDPCWGFAQDRSDSLWYPVQWSGNKIRDKIRLGFENAGDCSAYLIRSGLEPHPLPVPPGIVLGEIRGSLRWSSLSSLTCKDLGDPAPVEDAGPPDDDRFEWVEVTTFGGRLVHRIKGQCNHVPDSREPVDSYPSGELVAWLCTDCGETFEPDRWPCPPHMWRRIPDAVQSDRPVPANGYEKWVGADAVPAPDDSLRDHWTLVYARAALNSYRAGFISFFRAVWDINMRAWPWVRNTVAIVLMACYPVAVSYVVWGTLFGWWE